MKRVVFSMLAMLGVVALVLAMTPAPALADTIEISATGTASSSSWSWNGAVGGALTGSLTNPTSALTVGRQGAIALGPFSFTGTYSWTTGGFAGTTAIGPLTFFNFGAGGNVSVATGGSGQSINGTFFAADTTLFTGTFTAASVVLNGSPTAGFDATFILGTVNPNLLTALDFASSPTGATGAITGNLNGAPLVAGQANSGTIGSSDLTLNVPEPGTLVLLGTGLLGLAGIFRRKISG